MNLTKTRTAVGLVGVLLVVAGCWVAPARVSRMMFDGTPLDSMGLKYDKRELSRAPNNAPAPNPSKPTARTSDATSQHP